MFSGIVITAGIATHSTHVVFSVQSSSGARDDRSRPWSDVVGRFNDHSPVSSHRWWSGAAESIHRSMHNRPFNSVDRHP